MTLEKKKRRKTYQRAISHKAIRKAINEWLVLETIMGLLGENAFI